MSEGSDSVAYVGDLLTFAPDHVRTLGPRPGSRCGLRRGMSATSWYELGCRLEASEPARAIAAYERAIELAERSEAGGGDPAGVADAHYNLARLLELTGRRMGDELMLRRAIRHLLRYRELTRRNARAH